MLKTVSRIVALFVVAIVMSLTFDQSGHTAACVVERGIDPLDVLKRGVRHNVWIGLDTSGSMQGGIPGGTTKAAAARDVILTLMDELVDGDGDPLVNWGFTYFDLEFNRKKAEKCGTSAGDTDGDGYPDFPSPDANLDGLSDTASACVGRDQVRIDPEPCSDYDPRQDIRDTLLALYDGDDWVENAGGTPNGVFLEEMSTDIRDSFYPNLLVNQKNFVILLTDGDDTCECFYSRWDDLSADVKVASSENQLRGSDATSDLTDPFDEWGDAANPPPNCTGPLPLSEVNSNGSCQHQVDVAAYNAGLRGRVSFPRIAWGADRHVNAAPGDPGLGDPQGDAYVVGLGLGGRSKRRTNHLAWEASGIHWGRPGHGAFFADSKDELLEQFRDIFSRIGVPESTVSLGASVVGTVKEVVHSDTNTANGLVAADLLASGIADTEVRKRRASHRNNVLFTTSVDVPGFKGHLRATNIYNVDSDGNRTADFTELWDAGQALQVRDLVDNPRDIYYHRSNGTGGQLGDGTLLAADLGVAAGFLSDLDPTGVGAKTDADAVEIVEKIIQGWRLVVDSTHGFYQPLDSTQLNFDQLQEDGTPTWKLFEAANAAPAVVLEPARSPDVDPPSPAADYGTFYEDRINRMTTVYLGTGGGMMHAFRADNGYEIYGYIPHDLLPKLPNLVRNLVDENNGVLNHEFFIASSATVEDAYLKNSPNGLPEWRTVLAFGRGAGGKFLTGLDISDVGEWDGTNSLDVPVGFQAPFRLFTVGNNDGVVDQDINGESYDGFGETWSIPVMGRVHDGTGEGQWVLFAGGGYGCADGTDPAEGRYLYVLKLEDGTIYRKLPPVDDVVDGSAGEPGIDQNGLVATPALFNPHEPGHNDGRDFVTRVYIGDLQGVIHKLDATDDDPANWQFGPFFELTSEADDAPGEGNHDQPITVQAAVLKLTGSDDIFLFVGSGGDSRVQLTDPERFKIVGVHDTDNAGTVPTSDPAFQGSLLTLDGGTDKFFFDLPDGDRMTVPAVLARNTATNGVVFFATVRSEFDLVECQTTFFSTLFAAGVTTGLGSFDLDPSTAGVQDSMDLGAGKVTGLFHRDEHLYVSKSGQIGAASGTDVLGSDSFPTPIPTAGTVQILVDGFRYSPF